MFEKKEVRSFEIVIYQRGSSSAPECLRLEGVESDIRLQAQSVLSELASGSYVDLYRLAEAGQQERRELLSTLGKNMDGSISMI